MAVRGAHLAMAALAVVSFGSGGAADAQGVSEAVAAPEITARSQVYQRTDFDLSGDMDFYPWRALNEEVAGTSVVICQVGGDGEVERCVVESEKPAGYGFGKAHAMMVMKHVQVDVAEHAPGTWIRHVNTWSVG